MIPGTSIDRALKTAASTALLCSLLVLAACGQRGPLYLPEQPGDQPGKQQADAPDPQPDEENDEENSGT